MIRELQAWLIKLRWQAVGFSMVLMSIVNAVLLGALLYIVLPQYNQTIDRPEMLKRIEVLTHTLSIDVVNVWQVNLVQNSRTYIGSHVLDNADLPIVNAYVESIRTQSFTSTLPAEVALSLMSGNTVCKEVFGVKVPNPDTQKFREAIRARQACWVPVLSKQGNLIGYAIFIWKEMISQEELASFMTRGIGLINQ